MPISRVSEVVSPVEHVAPFDMNMMYQALFTKNQKFEQNYQNTQNMVNRLGSLDLVRNVDREYLQGKVQGLVQEINSVGPQDYSNTIVSRQIQGLSGSITNDQNIINAYSTTKRFRNEMAVAEMYKKDPRHKGKYASQNEWYMLNGDAKNPGWNKYLQSGTVGESFVGPSLSEYKDYNKYVLDNLKALKASGEITVKDFDRGVKAIMNNEGVSNERVREIYNSMPAEYREQMRIDGLYQYRNVPPDLLKKEYQRYAQKNLDYADNHHRYNLAELETLQSRITENSSPEDKARLATAKKNVGISKDYLDRIRTEASDEYINELVNKRTDEAKDLLFFNRHRESADRFSWNKQAMKTVELPEEIAKIHAEYNTKKTATEKPGKDPADITITAGVGTSETTVNAAGFEADYQNAITTGESLKQSVINSAFDVHTKSDNPTFKDPAAFKDYFQREYAKFSDSDPNTKADTNPDLRAAFHNYRKAQSDIDYWENRRTSIRDAVTKRVDTPEAEHNKMFDERVKTPVITAPVSANLFDPTGKTKSGVKLNNIPKTTYKQILDGLHDVANGDVKQNIPNPTNDPYINEVNKMIDRHRAQLIKVVGKHERSMGEMAFLPGARAILENETLGAGYSTDRIVRQYRDGIRKLAGQFESAGGVEGYTNRKEKVLNVSKSEIDKIYADQQITYGFAKIHPTETQQKDESLLAAVKEQYMTDKNITEGGAVPAFNKITAIEYDPIRGHFKVTAETTPDAKEKAVASYKINVPSILKMPSWVQKLGLATPYTVAEQRIRYGKDKMMEAHFEINGQHNEDIQVFWDSTQEAYRIKFFDRTAGRMVTASPDTTSYIDPKTKKKVTLPRSAFTFATIDDAMASARAFIMERARQKEPDIPTEVTDEYVTYK